MSDPVVERIVQAGVIPVIAIDQVEHALPLADALLAGGLEVIEITFRTRVAAEVIEILQRERPEMLIGAGTVLTEANLADAGRCGARFGLAPGFNPVVVRKAVAEKFPFFPGIATPTELEAALTAGVTTVKLFPVGLLGGMKMIEALAGPYGHTGVRFVPTGGVTTDNLEAYLSCPSVAAVGGTWLAKREDLARGRWDAIRRRVAAAVETVARVRR